jgi:DNA-binding response OmpR family regulator
MTTALRQDTTIFLVEDDMSFAAMLSDALGMRGYHVCHVTNAAEAEAMIGTARANVILLDLMLPDRNGLVLCINLKARASVPLIVCSATKRKDDAVLASQLGADDFLAKPFSVDELQARIELALKRPTAVSPTGSIASNRVLRIGQLTIERSQHRVGFGHSVLHLTPTEYRLLCVLASQPNQVLSRTHLAETVWGTSDVGILDSLEVHLRRLRIKLTQGGVSRPRLVTRRGFGYQLVDEGEAASRGAD